MPRTYPMDVRRQLCDRMVDGELVAAIAAETGISPATLFNWKRQALIDAGLRPGVTSAEVDELTAARKRITQLEEELRLTRDACELFNAQVVVPPKRRRAITDGLVARGHSIRSSCRITGLNRSNWIYHQNRKPSDREIRRLIVGDTIAEIHHRSGGTYGIRRVRASLLNEFDMVVNRKLIRSVMRERGLAGLPKPRQRKPNLVGLYTPSDLVERAFTADAPNKLWCTDITEHPARDGKAYCCAVIDCFSRKIVGRAFSTIADTTLVNNAVNMAVRERSPSGATVLHADHGTQFTSWSWGENLRRSGLTPSFGSVGDCFDNAVIEAFWGRMQVELLNTKKWATTFELVVAMANWIDTLYNTERVHSFVGNISPDQYEALWASTEPFELQ